MRQARRTAYWMLVATLVLSVIVAGCSGGAKETSSGQNQEQQQAQEAGPTAPSEPKSEPKAQTVTSVNMGTNAVGSSFHAMGTGIASVVNKYSSVNVKVVPLTGSTEWIPMLNTKEIDLGIVGDYEAALALKGEREFQDLSQGKGFPLRLVAIGNRSMVGLATAETTGIKSARDIKGKRYAYAVSGGSDFMQTSAAVLANLGLSEKDIVKVPITSPADTVKALIDGRADVATPAVGAPAVQELEAAKGARFLSLDPSPEAVKRAEEIMPGSFRLVKLTPESGFVGIKDEVYVRVRNTYLVARADLEGEVVEKILEALWDHNADLRAISKDLDQWEKEKFALPIATIPFHEAAVRFYQAKGIWTEEMEAKQKELSALVK